ncbi:hypothetical protein [Enterococcus sp.]|uniref:hypothetical protein n=1 Tax=Enterococcus sp. TaxID=35783 RepID=UPI002FC7F317
MKSYWYVTKCKLKPNRRGLVSVLLRKNYTIVELAVEADKDMEREFGLKYLKVISNEQIPKPKTSRMVS